MVRGITVRPGTCPVRPDIRICLLTAAPNHPVGPASNVLVDQHGIAVRAEFEFHETGVRYINIVISQCKSGFYFPDVTFCLLTPANCCLLSMVSANGYLWSMMSAPSVTFRLWSQPNGYLCPWCRLHQLPLSIVSPHGYLLSMVSAPSVTFRLWSQPHGYLLSMMSAPSVTFCLSTSAGRLPLTHLTSAQPSPRLYVRSLSDSNTAGLRHQMRIFLRDVRSFSTKPTDSTLCPKLLVAG